MDFVEPLALIGLVLVVLLNTNSARLDIDPVRDQQFKLRAYCVLCLTLPVMLMGLAVASAAGRPRAWRRLLVGVGVVEALFVCGTYGLGRPNEICIGCAVVEIVLMGIWGVMDSLPRTNRSGYAAAIASAWTALADQAKARRPLRQGISTTVLLLTALAAWTTAVKLWDQFTVFHSSIASDPESTYYGWALMVSVLLASRILCGRSVSYDVVRAGDFVKGSGSEVRCGPAAFAGFGIAFALWDFAVAILFLLASFRTAGLFEFASFHHWGVCVGAAQMVRQGGWLLWDVPSQYGLLYTLSVAWLPIKSVWTSLHCLSGFCQTCTAFGLYCVIKRIQPGFASRVFAAGLVLSIVYVMAPHYIDTLGPQMFPSVESYRFIWVYGAIALILLDYRRILRGQQTTRMLVAGCVCWLAGVFWSFESAYFTSATWLPAFYLAVWQRAQLGRQRSSVPTGPLHLNAARRDMIALALTPPMLLLIGIGSIDAVYLLGLHHLPDWAAYVEFVRSFGNGFGGWALDRQGSIWVVFICCIAPATVALALFIRDRVDPAVPVLIAAAAMVLSVGSYCMDRSHPNNILNILPFCVLAGALSIRLAHTHLEAPATSREGVEARNPSTVPLFVRTCLIPIFAVCLVAGVHTPAQVLAWVHSTLVPPVMSVDSRLPALDPEAVRLMHFAGVGPSDPLFFYDINLPKRDGIRPDAGPHRSFVPYGPLAALDPLPPARGRLYLRRFTDRVRLSGWVLIPADPDLRGYDDSWVLPSLDKYFDRTRSYRSLHYTLVYMRYTGERGRHRTRE
ncbi:MAG: hypothetical protein ACLQVD_03430 [Capsulimonadaceae bacterium]